MIRVKRKYVKLDEFRSEVEEDYLLEREGDITKYLQGKNLSVAVPRYDNNGNLVAHSVIGPASLFVTDTTDPQLALKKSRSVDKRRKKTTNVNPEMRFTQILEQISNMKKTAVLEERKKFKQSSQRQQLLDTRQNSVMQSFRKTEKYWQNLETHLAVKSNKKLEELIYTKSINSRAATRTPERTMAGKSQVEEGKLMWYMRLRESPEEKKYEAFINVGNALSGLYTRVQVDKSSVDLCGGAGEGEEIDNESRNDLQVVGNSKLPLEIEAVQRLGCQYLKPELIDRGHYDEIFAEQYDQKAKARIL